MQKDPVISALLGALLLGAIATFLLGARYQNLSKQALNLHAQVANMQAQGVAAQSLANDALVYSRTHPNIIPVLQRVGLNIPSANPKQP
jgi:hypothetical protein